VLEGVASKLLPEVGRGQVVDSLVVAVHTPAEVRTLVAGRIQVGVHNPPEVAVRNLAAPVGEGSPVGAGNQVVV